ncbi:MAG: stage II sporulation protein P [Bacilli bacterium]|nr:stage II sporulation protein P [Bacilli bacterium]
MKKFKSKKIKKRNKRLRLVIFVFFFIFSYIFIIRYLRGNMLKKDILNDDINYINFSLAKTLDKKVYNIVNNPVLFLDNPIKNVKLSKTKLKTTDKTITTNKVEKETIKVDYNSPIIYLYNTHQTEKYVNYDVFLAASYLKDMLNNEGMSTYFEENSIKTFLDNNNLKYYNSYTASKNYLKEALSKYNSIKYFFDIHRDSITKEKTTISYNNKNYAKILFVVGSDNKTNTGNLNNANKLNDIIKNKVPSISRGVVMHGGKGYNGVYNQDISENVFLIEIGGKDNNKDEVINTLNVLKDSITEYIRGVI